MYAVKTDDDPDAMSALEEYFQFHHRVVARVWAAFFNLLWSRAEERPTRFYVGTIPS